MKSPSHDFGHELISSRWPSPFFREEVRKKNKGFSGDIIVLLEDTQVLSHSLSVIELLRKLVPTFHSPETLESASVSEEYQIH